MLDKPLSQYTAWECLEEISKRVDRNTPTGKDIDLLAFQMATLCQGLASRMALHEETHNRALRSEAASREWLVRLYRDCHGKPVPWQQMRSVMAFVDEGITPEQVDAMVAGTEGEPA